MIGHVWVLGVLYKWAPGVYLWWAKRRYRHTNPDFIADVSSRLSDEWWPVILWRDAKRYLKAGGLEAYPRNSAENPMWRCRVVSAAAPAARVPPTLCLREPSSK